MREHNRERNLTRLKTDDAEVDLDWVEQARHLKDQAAELAKRVRGGARAAKEQVRHTAAEVTYAAAGAVREEAERVFGKQKSKATSKVARLGKSAHQVAHALHAVRFDAAADYVDAAAEQLNQASQYLEDHNLSQVIRDAGELARRHPAVAVGGMFLTGLALARFLKASAARANEGGGGRGGVNRGRALESNRGSGSTGAGHGRESRTRERDRERSGSGGSHHGSNGASARQRARAPERHSR